MAISKLILNGVTQMDVTDTTATVSDVASGKVFTQVDGVKGTGTASGSDWTRKDGKTHLHINVYNDVFLTVYLRFEQNINNGNTIDWGDGSAVELIAGTSSQLLPHTYADKGEYIITITNTNGTFTFGQTSAIAGYIFQQEGGNSQHTKFIHFASILEKIELGQGWDISYGRQFKACQNLTDVYINNKPSQTNLGASLFQNCKSLRSVSGAEGWDENIISSNNQAFSNTNLESSYIPPNLTAIPADYMNQYGMDVTALREINLHEGITAIGNNAFKFCANVPEITIPSTVTSIGQSAFEQSYGCHAVHMKPTSPPTLGNTAAFPTNNGQTYAQVMYVPYSADHSILEAYKTATNWSTYANYMQEEPQ